MIKVTKAKNRRPFRFRDTIKLSKNNKNGCVKYIFSLLTYAEERNGKMEDDWKIYSLQMNSLKRTILRRFGASFNVKSWLFWIVMLVAISLNQACVYIMLFVWKFDIFYFVALTFVFSLLFSVAVKNLMKSFILTLSSFVTGAVIALIILIMPRLLLGGGAVIDVIVQLYIIHVARLLPLSLPAAIFAVVLGSLLSGGI